MECEGLNPGKWREIEQSNKNLLALYLSFSVIKFYFQFQFDPFFRPLKNSSSLWSSSGYLLLVVCCRCYISYHEAIELEELELFMNISDRLMIILTFCL